MTDICRPHEGTNFENVIWTIRDPADVAQHSNSLGLNGSWEKAGNAPLYKVVQLPYGVDKPSHFYEFYEVYGKRFAENYEMKTMLKFDSYNTMNAIFMPVLIGQNPFNFRLDGYCFQQMFPFGYDVRTCLRRIHKPNLPEQYTVDWYATQTGHMPWPLGMPEPPYKYPRNVYEFVEDAYQHHENPGHPTGQSSFVRVDMCAGVDPRLMDKQGLTAEYQFKMFIWIVAAKPWYVEPNDSVSAKIFYWRHHYRVYHDYDHTPASKYKRKPNEHKRIFGSFLKSKCLDCPPGASQGAPGQSQGTVRSRVIIGDELASTSRPDAGGKVRSLPPTDDSGITVHDSTGSPTGVPTGRSKRQRDEDESWDRHDGEAEGSEKVPRRYDVRQRALHEMVN